MADEVPENLGGISANDRLADQGDTPMSPMVGGQPNPGIERGRVYTAAELTVMHDRDEAHQIRCATLLTDLTAFCAGPGKDDFNEAAYNAICQIPGCSLEPVAVMLAHGAAVCRQLEEFTKSQRELQDRLAAAESERDRLKTSADMAERIRQVGLKTSAHEGFTMNSPFMR
ncbi:hypothetical protein B484DRAFT_440852, partial [Ochromonadaceae sp. CCMP2298]